MKGARFRCPWSETHPLMQEYHDTEWGIPVQDDRKLFEFLVLEGAQAGLSWLTVLKKREAYRDAFAGFNPEAVARFGDEDMARLMQNTGIIRNRAKIAAATGNARAFLRVQEEFGNFASYMWGFVDGLPIVNTCRTMSDVPTHTPVSDAFSKDLIARGFRFVGSVICYSHMQAVGMVNDHLIECFRYSEVGTHHPCAVGVSSGLGYEQV